MASTQSEQRNRRCERTIARLHSRGTKLPCRRGCNPGRHNFVAGCRNCFPKPLGGLYCPLPKTGHWQTSRLRYLIYENGPACSTNAEALSTVGCRQDKNRTNSKRRIGPQILSDPVLGGAGAHFGKIQSGAGRKPPLRNDREFSYRTPNSCPGDLLSRC